MFLLNTNYVLRPNNSDSDLPSASVLAAGAGSFLPENDSYKVIKWWWRTEDRGRLILFSEGELFSQNIVKSAEEEEHRSEGWNTSAACFLFSAFCGSRNCKQGCKSERRIFRGKKEKYFYCSFFAKDFELWPRMSCAPLWNTCWVTFHGGKIYFLDFVNSNIRMILWKWFENLMC